MKLHRKKILFGLAAVSLPLLLMAAGFEVVLRCLEPAPPRNAGRVVGPSQNAAKQYELLPGTRGMVAGAPVSINSFGCRDREYSLKKPDGTVRIVGIGDSLTFGQGVREEETYLARLESELVSHGLKAEVINCGVFGYNVDEVCARFVEAASTLEPDIIMLGYELGDILRNPRPRKEALGERPGKKERAALIQKRSLSRILKRSRVVTFLAYRYSFLMKKLALRNWDDLYKDGHPLWENLDLKYERMGETARRKGIDVVVAVIPELSNLDERYAYKEVHARVERMCGNKEMTVIDLLPTFLGKHGPDFWVHPRDRHPNARGHELIAGGLAAKIVAMVEARGHPAAPDVRANVRRSPRP